MFAGLTAWDTQRIKEMYSAKDDGTVAAARPMMGALTLYLDFINLFLMLLRLVGDRRQAAAQDELANAPALCRGVVVLQP